MAVSPTSPVHHLPPELWDLILSHVPPSILQATAVKLIVALGHHGGANVSRAALWRHLRLGREGQAWEGTKALRAKGEEGFKGAVESVRAEAWREDPQLLVNFLMSFRRLRFLRLCVGPLYAPEHLEELLEFCEWKSTVRNVWFRFNPYVLERSYFTFLKGAYFDITALQLASWTSAQAPMLRKLAFVQDLPPNHGAAVKETPAFGLQPIADALGEILPVVQEEQAEKEKTEGKLLDFAQPIVFFKLFCLSTLATSPVGQQLTHLVLRLPRRNLLTALTSYSDPLTRPYSSMTHLDLSTTHLLADPRFSALLRLHPNLEHLVLDRCTGLIGPREAVEHPALLTLKWLGKNFGGAGAARGEEAMRSWRKIVKDRPTGLPAPGPWAEPAVVEKKARRGRSGYASAPRMKVTSTANVAPAKSTVAWTSDLPPLVKDVVMIPPAPKGKSFGFGLFPIDSAVEKLWRTTFMEGYNDALAKTADKIEEVVHRWEVWRDSGKLADGSKRMVTFADALPTGSPWLDWDWEKSETDEGFAKFCLERRLVVIDPGAAMEVLASIKAKTFVFCTVPDCSGAPGVPHVSLNNISKEDKGVREAREKKIWEEEIESKKEWRRPDTEHQPGCAHLCARESWDL